MGREGITIDYAWKFASLNREDPEMSKSTLPRGRAKHSYAKRLRRALGRRAELEAADVQVEDQRDFVAQVA